MPLAKYAAKLPATFDPRDEIGLCFTPNDLVKPSATVRALTGVDTPASTAATVTFSARQGVAFASHPSRDGSCLGYAAKGFYIDPLGLPSPAGPLAQYSKARILSHACHEFDGLDRDGASGGTAAIQAGLSATSMNCMR